MTLPAVNKSVSMIHWLVQSVDVEINMRCRMMVSRVKVIFKWLDLIQMKYRLTIAEQLTRKDDAK